MSTADSTVLNFLVDTGYRSEGDNLSVVNMPVLGTDSLLGVRYIVSDYALEGMDKVEDIADNANGAGVYENPYSLPTVSYTHLKGVDADVADAVTEDTLDNAVAFVKKLSAETGSIIAVTGAIDLVADSEKCYVIRNGRPEMGKITGTGCQLSGMMTAYVVANQDNKLEAAEMCIRDSF